MELTDFTRDLTAEAEAGLLERPIGRDRELDFILKTISQEGKSNVLIVGPAGSGKTVLAEGLAYLLMSTEVPPNYIRKRVLELNLTAMNSGAMYVGQFEERVNKFIESVKSDPSIVVFIDEIHMLMGFGKAGDGGAARDMSQIIKPPLASGQICCVGATTLQEFNSYIAQDAAFVRRFQLLELKPLRSESVLQILGRASLKNKYVHGIEFTADTLALMVDISEKLYPNRSQPDKAIDILRRLTTALQSRFDSRDRQSGKTLKEYVDLLEKQLKHMESRDYERVRETAKAWLGITGASVRTIDLSEEQMKSKLGI